MYAPTVQKQRYAEIAELACKTGSRYPESYRNTVKLLKSTFNAETFMRWLSWSISSDFSAIHSRNVCHSLKSRKIY